MLTDSQARIHAITVLGVGVIYTSLFFNALFTHCPTISCICGSNSYFQYIWLNLVCCVAGLQMWIKSLPEPTYAAHAGALFPQLPWHKRVYKMRRLYFRRCIKALVVISVMCIGVFPSATDNNVTLMKVNFFAGHEGINPDLSINTTLTCTHVGCNGFDRETGHCSSMYCDNFESTQIRGLPSPIFHCNRTSFSSCTCKAYHPIEGYCSSVQCDELYDNAPRVCGSNLTNGAYHIGEIHLNSALIFMISGCIMLGFRTWRVDHRGRRIRSRWELARTLFAYISAVLMMVLNTASRVTTPTFCVEDAAHVCTNVSTELKWINFFAALFEALLVATIYSSALFTLGYDPNDLVVVQAEHDYGEGDSLIKHPVARPETGEMDGQGMKVNE